ncbi:MAG TPA: glycosyl hydrolase family 28 protein [Opitutaceae bacterium]|jgi:polygalacturonase|nr:glycosyl hydrolase family 28 protein [Opitutaceae bacterium]
MRLVLPCLALCLASCLNATPALAARVTDFSVADFGATGRDIHADTAAIQKAIDTCSSQGGGRVVIPAGSSFTVGTIILKSHVDLHLERGALLEGSPTYADYTRFAPQPVSFDPGPIPMMGVLVYADGAEDIAITGAGKIDGNEMAYVTKVGPYIYTCVNARPFEVVLKGCRHVLMRDVTLSNSAFWTLRLLGCDDAFLDGLRIDGDLRMPNNDGLDIDRSSNVRVIGCNISTGDDCISLKAVPLSEGITKDCENITIANCTLRSRSSGLVLGCDVGGQIHDVVMNDCVIRDSHRGVSVRLSLGGSIVRALFSNMIIETKIFDSMWWGRGEPIQVEAVRWNATSDLGVVKDIRFSNIICNSENGAMVWADEPGHIDNISFDHVSVHIVKPVAFAGGQQDLRPTANEGLPKMPTNGFILRQAANVSFKDCSVTWGPMPPDYFAHALDAAASPGLDDTGLTGEAAQPGMPAKVIK